MAAKITTAPNTYMGFTLDKRGRFNGKPLEYWHAKSDELLMQCLISAMNVDTRSLPGAIVHERIKSLAQAINPEVFKRVWSEIMSMKAAIPLMVAAILGNDDPKMMCPKHARDYARAAKKNARDAAKRKRRKKPKKENRVDPLD